MVVLLKTFMRTLGGGEIVAVLFLASVIFLLLYAVRLVVLYQRPLSTFYQNETRDLYDVPVIEVIRLHSRSHKIYNNPTCSVLQFYIRVKLG